MQPGVLFLVNSLGVGGAERHVVSLLNNLDWRAYRLALGYLKSDDALLPQLKTERLDAVISLNVQHKLDLNVVRTIANFMNEHDIKVVVSANQYPLLYSMLAARRVSRPPRQVEVFHTTTPQTLKERLQMSLYRSLFRRLDLLVYVSQLQRGYWNAWGLSARRDIVIHNGIDTHHFMDNFTSAQKQALRERYGFLVTDYLIGICAALRPEKAHRDFLLAIARLRNAGQPAKGLIIGDGSERGTLERQIEQLGIARHVVITGFQPDVRAFIAACDVMTLTSHAVETFSLAALEAMAMAKPVVITEIGGAAEQVEPGVDGFLFAPGDIDALTGFLSALSSPECRASMGRAAQASVRERFPQSKMIEAYSREFGVLAHSL